MSAADHVPDGAMVTARIEILELLLPDGSMSLTYYVADSDDEELELSRTLGLITRAKFNIVKNSPDGWL